mmetsp:Transcript_3248/g.10078  ORF Transcript_3248/g.10078 Transcript_3248/m.10078 type:complete len:218 (+) Transcript_3248:762-1415(+)
MSETTSAATSPEALSTSPDDGGAEPSSFGRKMMTTATSAALIARIVRVGRTSLRTAAPRIAAKSGERLTHSKTLAANVRRNAVGKRITMDACSTVAGAMNRQPRLAPRASSRSAPPFHFSRKHTIAKPHSPLNNTFQKITWVAGAPSLVAHRINTPSGVAASTPHVAIRMPLAYGFISASTRCQPLHLACLTHAIRTPWRTASSPRARDINRFNLPA